MDWRNSTQWTLMVAMYSNEKKKPQQQTAQVMSSKRPEDMAIQFVLKWQRLLCVFSQNIYFCLLSGGAWMLCTGDQRNATQMPMFTCSQKLLCIDDLRETKSFLCKVISNTTGHKRWKENVWGCQHRGGMPAMSQFCWSRVNVAPS